MKRCNTCDVEKPLECYNKNKRSTKDGLDNKCKDCYKVKYNDTREKNLECQRKWRENNKDYQKEWQKSKGDELIEYRKEYYENNSSF